MWDTGFWMQDTPFKAHERNCRIMEKRSEIWDVRRETLRIASYELKIEGFK